MSLKDLMKIKIYILLISYSFIIFISFLFLFENYKNQELRKSRYQIKIKDFWENEFITFLAIMIIIEIFIYYKNILNKKDYKKWKWIMNIEYKFIIKIRYKY